MFENEKPILKLSKWYLFSPLVLVVFLILFVYIYNDIRERTIVEFNNEQLILAETASKGIVSFFEDYKSDLAFLSQQNDVIKSNAEGEKLLKDYFNNQSKQISAVTRIDKNGRILYTFPYFKSLIGKDISFQKHINHILNTHKPVISDMFMSVEGYLAIALHVPVFDKGEFCGSLAILIPIDKLGEKHLGNIKIHGKGNVWLLSENGVEIYCPVSDHIGKTFLDITHHDPSSVEFLKTISKQNSGTVSGIHQNVIIKGEKIFPEKYLTFYRTCLGNTYWTIVISYQQEDIYVALTKLRNRLILIFSIIIVIMLYYFYSFVKANNVINEEAKRRESEKILRLSEAKFRTIFDESPIGIELYGADGMQLNANRASLTMFGIDDVSEILKFNLFDGTTMDEEKKHKLKNGESITYQSLFNFEKVNELQQYYTHKKGLAYFDYIITPLLNHDDNSINGYLLQVQDISERKRSEEEILMLAHSLRCVNECVSITDLDDKILFVNEAFLNTYGYTESELIGKHVSFLRSDENPDEVEKDILPSTLNAGGWRGELKNKRKDGSEFPIYLSTTIIKDKNGKHIGLIGVASDISERKANETELINAKERAEESDRLKSAFLANMSHEIRTPMNGILGFADLLKEPHLSGEEQQSYIRIIEKSGERMLNIINDIIDISKIDSGLMTKTIAESDINTQIDYIYTFFKPEAERNGLKLTAEKALNDSEAVILTDKEKVFAILTNLVKNAIKFTNEGSIEFGYTKTGDYLRFYVKDSGVGVKNEHKELIFERFRQGSESLNRNYEGAGLGLAISKSYVEMLGGQMWLESEEGRGSVFYFTLPYHTKTTEVPNTLNHSAKATDNINIKKIKILIAEDDETSAKLITALVNSISNEIIIARNGKEAVEACRNNSDIDLILMDVKMTGISGYEATQQIRQFNSDVIIIAQTAFAMLGDKQKALEAGCNDYISKPIKINLLREMINKYCI